MCQLEQGCMEKDARPDVPTESLSGFSGEGEKMKTKDEILETMSVGIDLKKAMQLPPQHRRNHRPLHS